MTMRDVLSLASAGQPVDFRQVARLQPIAIAAIGEQFAEEAAASDRRADTFMMNQLASMLGDGPVPRLETIDGSV